MTSSQPALPPRRLAGLLARQDAIVTRAQLHECGVPRGVVRAELDGARWRAINDAVLSTHNGPLTPRQSAWAAVLSAQFPAALCSLTAMQEWGISCFATPTVHLVIMRGAKVLGVPDVDVAVHESRRFTAVDVRYQRGLTMTSIERAVLDAAAWAPTLNTATRIVVAPVQQRLTTPARLLAELEQAGRVRHRLVLRGLLTDLDGGAEALSEVAFLRWCRRHGFPSPTLQVRLESNGRRRYIDATFELADGRRVLVEVDGGVHLTLATRWQDTAKDNDAVIAGETTLRFPSIAIYADDPVAVRQLRAALASVRRPGGQSHLRF